LERAVGAAAGLARLRDDAFDVVLLSHDESLNALQTLDAIRAGTSVMQPVIVLGQSNAAQMEPYCLEAHADSYMCLAEATTRTLIWRMAQAIERRQLRLDNERLQQARNQQQAQDKQEADRLLEQQRELVDLTKRGAAGGLGGWDPPMKLLTHYRELLKTSVVMGWGHVGDDVTRFTQILMSAGISESHFMALHVQAVESTVAELGSRGAKHVMNRADLLALEVLLRLCERYRSGILDSLGPDSMRFSA
jgi:CheY-like chemotaxis protein